VHGAADHVVPVAFAHAAAVRHPAWTYREVPDAGHYLHRDGPAAWAEIVPTWLAPRISRHGLTGYRDLQEVGHCETCSCPRLGRAPILPECRR
jgi:fermentation-respiration switch protein FrsA (DUF1100 family)